MSPRKKMSAGDRVYVVLDKGLYRPFFSTGVTGRVNSIQVYGIYVDLDEGVACYPAAPRERVDQPDGWMYDADELELING